MSHQLIAQPVRLNPRIGRDLIALKQEKDFRVVHEIEYNHWIIEMKGPRATPWEKGIFQLDVEIPNSQNGEKYPTVPPIVKFNTKVFHPNVYENGNICLNVLGRAEWSPTFQIHFLLISIQALLSCPNLKDPANPTAATLYASNSHAYLERVNECVQESIRMSIQNNNPDIDDDDNKNNDNNTDNNNTANDDDDDHNNNNNDNSTDNNTTTNNDDDNKNNNNKNKNNQKKRRRSRPSKSEIAQETSMMNKNKKKKPMNHQIINNDNDNQENYGNQKIDDGKKNDDREHEYDDMNQDPPVTDDTNDTDNNNNKQQQQQQQQQQKKNKKKNDKNENNNLNNSASSPHSSSISLSWYEGETSSAQPSPPCFSSTSQSMCCSSGCLYADKFNQLEKRYHTLERKVLELERTVQNVARQKEQAVEEYNNDPDDDDDDDDENDDDDDENDDDDDDDDENDDENDDDDENCDDSQKEDKMKRIDYVFRILQTKNISMTRAQITEEYQKTYPKAYRSWVKENKSKNPSQIQQRFERMVNNSISKLLRMGKLRCKRNPTVKRMQYRVKK